MQIRCAEVGEGGVLEAVQRRSSAVWPAYRERLAAHPDAIARLEEGELRAGRVRVAHQDGEVVGFSAVLATDPDGVVVLDGLFVESDAMGQGVGRALVEDAAARAADAGAVALTVVSGPETQAFYARCGFTSVADAPTRFGPAALLRRAL
jgi:predicted N-acetyltransferase YhbS